MPRISLVTKNPHVGKPLQLDCNVAGLSGVSTTWYKDNKLQQNNDHVTIMLNHTLLIPKAQVKDSGNYKCSVEYGNNQSFSSIYVTVNTLRIDPLTVGIHLCPDAVACEEYCNNFPVMALKGRCKGNNCECY
ncbi:hypothetical protein TNCV_262001 [Trichonephila clavipes]|nr:hypothetical protein TNCV_262001 [Trichonephila clavipes]